jgi:hypothetical protein
MPKESAIEILVFKPNAAIPSDKRGVHENLWIKQNFTEYLSVGVYLDETCLKYYLFEEFYITGKTYDSFVELKQDLPPDLKKIFESTPKLFIMGHGRGDQYGLGNHPIAIFDKDFDKIINDFTDALPKPPNEIFVTLEACNTDNPVQAAKGNQEKTFLERLSIEHPSITFCGTGPWEPSDPQTGYRASGGYPTLHAPITSMGGGIWKHGNSVIFHHGDYQVVAIKSMFASTKTAKALKINTIDYACEVLETMTLDDDARKKIIAEICGRRDILTIGDLNKFHEDMFKAPLVTEKVAIEQHILAKEKDNYITRLSEILSRSADVGAIEERDLLVIALGLKTRSIFEGNEALLDGILANKTLLALVMVSCGKVLVAGPSNDSIIDLLLANGIDVNSVDKNGMTALHHAVQGFYNYRTEPLALIKKLLDSGANLEAKDKMGRTALELAAVHAQKGTVIAGAELLSLLQARQVTPPTGFDIADSSHRGCTSSSSETFPGQGQAHLLLGFMSEAHTRSQSDLETDSSQLTDAFRP